MSGDLPKVTRLVLTEPRSTDVLLKRWSGREAGGQPVIRACPGCAPEHSVENAA